MCSVNRVENCVLFRLCTYHRIFGMLMYVYEEIVFHSDSIVWLIGPQMRVRSTELCRSNSFLNFMFIYQSMISVPIFLMVMHLRMALVYVFKLCSLVCVQKQFEIAERIRKGNRAYYGNAKLLKSKLLKISTKMRIYLTLIRPVVTYASETWTLTEKDELRLRIFGRQILRKIFGPIQIGNYCNNFAGSISQWKFITLQSSIHNS
jgi:hypothetical protein